MYSFLKNIVGKIFPKSFLFKNEMLLRKPLLPFYYGKKHQCNLCGTHLRRFQTLENGNLLCPICGSLPRTRRLWILLNELVEDQINVLDFSPHRALYRAMKEKKNISYTATDFESQFLADVKYDITSIDAPDNTFNLIICYHILEHITEDKKAMSELYRVLKRGGFLLIQTPFADALKEDSSIVEPNERLKHFGQEDHVRIYSIDVLVQRLQSVGFYVEVEEFGEILIWDFRLKKKSLFVKK